MGNTFDLQAWLKDLELSDDERKVLEPVLAKEAVSKKVGESFLRQSDYSRRMNELADLKKQQEVQLQQKLTELDAHEKGLVEWKGTADKTLAQREKEVERLNRELESTKNAMTKIQTEYGIDVSSYATPTNNPVQPKTFDDSVLGGYVKRDDFQKAVEDAQKFPWVAAELMDLASEHQEVFGKRLPKARELVERAIKEKKSLRDVWATEYKVEDKRAEIAKKAHDDEIERVRQETEARVRSELKIPAQRPNAARPLVLSDSLKNREIHTGPASDQSTVNAALEAYATGKYNAESQ